MIFYFGNNFTFLEQDPTYQAPGLIVTQDGSHTLKSSRFNATYHSVKGAVDESQHVFISNGLLRKMNEGPQELSVLELGFGTGLNAYLSYLKSRDLNRPIQYHTIEAFPITPKEATRLNYSEQDDLIAKEAFRQLHACEWNRECLISEQFRFTKYHTLFERFETWRRFDLVYYDAFSPGDQPELWTREILEKVAGLLNPGGILVTYCARGQMKRDLKSLGLNVKALKGAAGKREMTLAQKLH